MNSRHCPYCHCNTKVIRYGITSSGRQRYYCGYCYKTWTNKPRNKRLEKLIWHDYVWNNLPVRELSRKYEKSGNTIRHILHDYQPPPIHLSDEEKSKTTVIAMDTTYFGRTHGVVTVINAHSGELLYFGEISGTETNIDYKEAIDAIIKDGIKPKACLIDGRQGVSFLLQDRGILVQLCHFHVHLMVKKHLTNNPILEPNIELKLIVELLNKKGITETKFASMFFNWYRRHKTWLLERTYNEETHKREYTHQDTRRAFNAVRSHYDIMFTYEHYPELKIPRTSNMIEGKFGVAKNKLRIHHGYNKRLKIKIFFSLLSGK